MFYATMKFLGILMGSLSLVSLVNRLLDIGLAAEFARILEYYRNVIDCVFLPLQYITPFEIPRFLFDLWTLSFIGGASFTRSMISKGNLEHQEREDFKNPLGFMVTVLIYGLSGAGLLFILWVYSLTMDSLMSSKKRIEMKQSPQDWAMLREIQKNFLWVLAGCLAFYSLNSMT